MKASIFEYDNYREYLRDFYKAANAKNKNFSFRYLSRICGFKSTNFLHLVMNGKSNLSSKSAEKVAKALKLNKQETLFFKNLVLFNQCASPEEKRRLASELMRGRDLKKISSLLESQFIYFSNWYFVPIREMVELEDFNEDPKWIAAQIRPQITPEQAKNALEVLLKLGLLSRDSSGRLVQAESNVITPDEIISSFKAQCLVDLIKRGIESISTIPRDTRDISAVTFPISLETFEKVKGMIQRFREDILDVTSRDQSFDIVYQFNLQLFPLTDFRAKERK